MGGEDDIISCVCYVKVLLNIMLAKYNSICTQLLLSSFVVSFSKSQDCSSYINTIIKVTFCLSKAMPCGLLTLSVKKSSLLK